MSHRERERERDRGGDRDRGDRRREPRERDSGREPMREREPARPGRGNDLNEFFVDGTGIHREVMQREICKYLGPEAYSRPGAYNGIPGFIVTAVRPFTPKMIEDLQNLSEDYVSENQQMRSRGYQGSPMRASPVAGIPNQSPEIPYKDSKTSRRQDAVLTSDPYAQEARYVQQPVYSSAISQAGYPSTAGGYPPGPNYAPSQVPGYPPTSGYPLQGSAYPQSSGYPPQAGYPPQGTGYPTASGYAAAGYPATAGRSGNPNDMNYTYAEQTGEYTPQGYPYRQMDAYPSGAQARDPRSAAGYPYVTSSQDIPMRGSAIDERYDNYSQSIPAGRGGFAPPSRGTPTGYDPPPQPRDGFAREPIRDERRRR